MFSKIAFLFLIVCAAQVLAADPKLYDHARCIKDPETAIQSYDKLLKEFNTLQDKIWKTRKDTIKSLDRSAKTSVCANILEVLRNITRNKEDGVCEILIAGDMFEGPWITNLDVSKEDICDFIAANQPTLEAIVEHNQNLSSKCSKVTTGQALKDNCDRKDNSELNRPLPYRTRVIYIIEWRITRIEVPY